MCRSADNSAYLNKWIPDMTDRCKQVGRTFIFDGTEFTKFEFFLIAVFKKPLRSIMQELYVDAEMSVPDICKAFREQLEACPSDRTIQNLIKRSGVPMRTRAECKALSWRQGKMDGSIAKARQASKKTYLLGSKAEQQVRYLLREAFIALDLQFDIVIGDNLQHILERFEIDIPLVLVDRETSKACRIAVEVDNTFTHSGEKRQKRDARKDKVLNQAGWHVIRVNGDHFNKKKVLIESVTNLALRIEQIAEEALVKHSFPEAGK